GPDQRTLFGGVKAARVAHVVENTVVVVKAEEQAAYRAPFFALVPAIAADHAVHSAKVLDLCHRPYARMVGLVESFGNDTIEAGAFEALEPVKRGRAVYGAGGDVRRLLRMPHEAFETGAAL